MSLPGYGELTIAHPDGADVDSAALDFIDGYRHGINATTTSSTVYGSPAYQSGYRAGQVATAPPTR